MEEFHEPIRRSIADPQVPEERLIVGELTPGPGHLVQKVTLLPAQPPYLLPEAEDPLPEVLELIG